MLASRHSWQLRPAASDRVAEIEHDLGLHPLTARLLVIRGLCSPQEAQRFLDRRLQDLHDPSGLPDMDVAAQRFAKAIAHRHKILIHGDFDVDGSTATALLLQFCRLCAHDAVAWIPDRIDDGYGLGEGSLQAVREHQAELLITVDCGTQDNGWAARIEAETGCAVIITDHHLPGSQLPHCVALVNPNLPGHDYPDRYLAGVGVAWKLAWATARELCGSRQVPERHRAFLLDALALVALGTVADCAPLDGDNRILVHHGLQALRRTPNPGLRALIAVLKLDDGIDAETISWRLAPVLNAAGRLGSAMDNIALLTTGDPAEAEGLVRFLVGRNEERRRLTEILTDDLIHEIESNPAYAARSSLVFAGDGWHPGIVGIVANRLAERFTKPSAVISLDGDVGKGSLRSAAGVHLGEAIDACQAHLCGGGGHAKAAGISLRADQVAAFAEAFEAHVRSLCPGGPVSPGIAYDAVIRVADLDAGLFADIARLEPFGIGNPSPVVRVDGARFITRPELFGRGGDHLRGALSDAHGGMCQFLAWRAKRHYEAFSQPRGSFDLLVRPEINRWRGNDQYRLVYIDGKTP